MCGQANVQSELDGVTRNRAIFERIAKELKLYVLSYPLALQITQVFTFAFSVFSSSSDTTVFPSTLFVHYVFYAAVDSPEQHQNNLTWIGHLYVINIERMAVTRH